MKKIISVLLFIFSFPIYGQNLDMKKLINAAENGDPSAQYVLGDCFEHGNQIQQSYTNAAIWYTKSSIQGYTNAQFKLGKFYAEGLGVEQSYFRAVELWELSAKKGDVVSMYNLGIAYYYGDDKFKADLKKSLYWFETACKNNDEESCNIIKQFK